MDVTQPWHAVLPREVAEQATSAAPRVAERLRDPEPRRGAGEQTETGVGRALLHGRLDRYQPGRDWAAAAHASLNSTIEAVEQAGARILGLFGGLSGAAFAARSLASGGRYGNLLTQLDCGVASAVTRRAAAIVGAPWGRPAAEVDLVSGMPGYAAYLLFRDRVEPALEAALQALVAICELGSSGVPNWYTAPAAMVAGSPLARAFPDGVFNCGLAHGIPGPLAVLALAHRAGIEVPGQPDAIKRVAYWLADHRADDAWGPSSVHLHANRLLGCGHPPEQRALGLLLRTRESLRRAPV